MDKHRVDGASKQVAGSLKEAVGKVTGDRKTQAEGAAQKAAGKVERGAGRVADKARAKSAK